jgi:hypothetical protein
VRASVLLVLVAACGFEVSGGGVGPSSDASGATSDADTDAALDPDGGTVLDPDASPIDASPPIDAPVSTACGDVGEACCATANEPACEAGGECTAGTCTACGALLQSCCDPGGTCGALSLCLGGTCASI